MSIAASTSRGPRGLRGAALRVALRELGNDVETPPPSAPASVPPAPPPLPEPFEVANDSGPPALRPEQLLRWLEARR